MNIEILLIKNLPKPIKALRIHLKAGFFRNGKIIAPPNAEQLIKVTAINPTRISKFPIEIIIIKNKNYSIYTLPCWTSL